MLRLQSILGKDFILYDASIVKRLTVLIAQKALGAEVLFIEPDEYDYFISSDHEMTKEHYIEHGLFYQLV